MPRFSTIAAFAFLALGSILARAEDAEITVPDNRMAVYDISTLKAGDFVESEMVSKYEGMDESKTKMRLACVGIEGDVIWIEEVCGDFVTLYGISKSTGKIKEAWEGQAGEVGKQLKVVPPAAPPAAGKEAKVTGTGKVSRETLKVNGKDLDCEKVETTVTILRDAKESSHTSTNWTSEKLPFRRVASEVGGKSEEIKWEGKPTNSGAMVKWSLVTKDSLTTTTATSWGTDAKPTLKRK